MRNYSAIKTRPSTLNLAARIIARADKAHPADEMLRRELKRMGVVSHELARELSRAVFSYFRWKGWLAERSSIEEKVHQALDLADRYAREAASFSDDDLAQRVAPRWVNEELEVTFAWARALQANPRLWLRARPGQGKALAGKLRDARLFDPGRLAEIIEYCGEIDLLRTPEFHAGEFEIQDISSQAVGLVCDPQAGETWWDACAGEGGKLLHLSDLMRNKGLIWATDRAPWRLQRLMRRAARARAFNYRRALWDGGGRLPTRTAFDGVLVDAPCSGLGTWHRNPHARWTTLPSDVQELAQLQKKLLANAAKAVKPTGRLIYAVCTVTRAETRQVVEAFETSCPELEPLPISNPLQQGSAPEHGLFIRTEQFGGNGMFLAAWRRNEAHKRAAFPRA